MVGWGQREGKIRRPGENEQDKDKTGTIPGNINRL